MNFFVLFVEKEPKFFTVDMADNNIALIEKKFNESSCSCYISVYENEQAFKNNGAGTILKSRTV